MCVGGGMWGGGGGGVRKKMLFSMSAYYVSMRVRNYNAIGVLSTWF